MRDHTQARQLVYGWFRDQNRHAGHEEASRFTESHWQDLMGHVSDVPDEDDVDAGLLECEGAAEELAQK